MRGSGAVGSVSRSFALGVLVAVWIAPAVAAEPERPCAPLPGATGIAKGRRDARRVGTVAAALGEPGLRVTPEPTVLAASASATGRADPPAAALPTTGDPHSEVLLVLPKGADGTVPTDFELAPGASLASSFWSPVLCASVARVVGPPGTASADLVARLPETAMLAANEVYVTAEAEATPAPSRPPAGAGSGEGDPYRPLQYALDRMGIDAARAVTDGRGAVVALLDSAPAVPHRDLPAVQVVAPEAGEAWPAGLHGTLMAGVIGAAENNGFGIAGIAPGASLLAVPVCTPEPDSARDRCRLFDLLRGLDTAWDRQAQIVNLSLVGPPSRLLERAMARLDDLGVVVVAAAGNEGTDGPRYPAAYPSVVGVAAVNREGHLWSRSNRGVSAEIAAPGVGVLSTAPGDHFAFGDGTSLAAAQVSGLLALLTSATGDPIAARRALFRAGHAPRVGIDPATAGVTPACRLLARLEHPCGGGPAPASP